MSYETKKKTQMTFAQKKPFYLFINKENKTWRTQLHEGTPTMAPNNMCKQARVIDTNQIQSKTQQLDKILNHRDLSI